jgi:hypothetical protein
MTTDGRATVVANLHLADDMQEVASGVDAFYLSGFCEIPARFWSHLVELKARAAETNESVSLALGSASFAVNAGGLPRYPVRLDHPYCAVGVTASASLPALRFQPRSEVLQSEGAQAAADWFRRTFEPLVGELRLGVSRLDLFTDVQGWIPEPDDRLRMLGRARAWNTYEDTEELTGFSIGRRKSGLTFRIYDKTLDCARKRVGFWTEVWGDRLDPEQPVWRFEAVVHRSVLRMFGADTPEVALERVGGIWRYVTEQWLSLRVPTSDETRTRWPLDARWKFVQDAALATGAVALERLREANDRASLDWWLPRVVGGIAHAGALTGAITAEQALLSLPALVELHELQGGRSLQSRLDELHRGELAS